MRLYPGGPPKRPYDITGWTLNDQMGVTVDRVMERVDVATERVDVAPPPGVASPTGNGPFAIDPRANDAFIVVNRLLKAGDTIYRSASPINSWPGGAFIVAAGPNASAHLTQANGGRRVPLALPRQDPVT